MEVSEHTSFAVTEPSQVAAVRRAAVALAGREGLDEEDVGRVALVVTEAATNLWRHATGGEILLGVFHGEPGSGVEVVVLDRGPGIAALAEALRDGYSSRGTSGNGLGAILRQATTFDAHSTPGVGTTIVARIAAKKGPRPSGIESGGFSVAMPGEDVSGDQWAIAHVEDRTRVLIADGLGHGLMANEAATRARASFLARPEGSPVEILERLHAELRPTRGAAAAVAEIDPGRALLRFAGVGNIAGTILSAESGRSVVSGHGTLGHDLRRIQGFDYPWDEDAVLVLHSDGLSSHWKLDAYPGICARHPSLVAAVLYRDFRRLRDDTTVVVLRSRP